MSRIKTAKGLAAVERAVEDMAARQRVAAQVITELDAARELVRRAGHAASTERNAHEEVRNIGVLRHEWDRQARIAARSIDREPEPPAVDPTITNPVFLRPQVEGLGRVSDDEEDRAVSQADPANGSGEPPIPGAGAQPIYVKANIKETHD